MCGCGNSSLESKKHVPGPPKVPKTKTQYHNTESIGSIGPMVLGILGGPGRPGGFGNDPDVAVLHGAPKLRSMPCSQGASPT